MVRRSEVGTLTRIPEVDQFEEVGFSTLVTSGLPKLKDDVPPRLESGLLTVAEEPEALDQDLVVASYF